MIDRASNDRRVPWRGLNHLALITNDMDATVRFWHGVIDAPLVATVATGEFRHYFFALGPSNSVAFFEYRGQATTAVAKPAGVFDTRAGQFDHVSLDLPDEESLLALRSRLREHGCEVTEVVDHGLMRSIYFTDPNGIALEASWWADDPTVDPSNPDDLMYFRDPQPVAAVHEIAAGGLGSTPATRLVSRVADNHLADV